MGTIEQSVAELLSLWREGKQNAFRELVDRLYPQMKTIASAQLRRSDGRLELQTTELANEAFFRLRQQHQVDWANEDHFLAIVATVMRRIVVDHARNLSSQKRGGGWLRIQLDEELVSSADQDDLIALDDCLNRLTQIDAIGCQLIELRFFAGLSIDRAAEALGIGRATAVRKWRFARAWLKDQWSPELI